MKQNSNCSSEKTATLHQRFLSGVLRASMVLGSVVLALPHSVRAEPLPLPDQGRYTVIHQTLPDVLTQFCEDVNLRVVVDPSIQGNVRSGFTAETPLAFLNALSTEYRLDWYYDGNTLHVTPSSATTTQSFPLGGVSYAALMRAVDAKKMLEPHYSVHTDDRGRSVSVFGPPDLRDRISQTIQSLSGPGAGHRTVRIFRGSAVQDVSK
ncbi:hypothetical protein [Gluconobacter kondonii]|uniref:hypothetical protein n=1 Tax=Gluconobacter kondonii TaxID=941463 RepID=UPI001B8AC48A|nr:hypothetical protein [Gluconobacter kondonii]MBS1066572.1 hypothetical protein [Gluconobacter kondonii]MBS1080532.1 hypothetical protein [Gluconobacter kondonii]MBS1083274.1 hypothetical protein [Gluconobacter kondonii]